MEKLKRYGPVKYGSPVYIRFSKVDPSMVVPGQKIARSFGDIYLEWLDKRRWKVPYPIKEYPANGDYFYTSHYYMIIPLEKLQTIYQGWTPEIILEHFSPDLNVFGIQAIGTYDFWNSTTINQEMWL